MIYKTHIAERIRHIQPQAMTETKQLSKKYVSAKPRAENNTNEARHLHIKSPV